MSKPTVKVIIEKGIARIEALAADAHVEVRNYDVECAADDHPIFWTDENGRRCVRYFVAGDMSTRTERNYTAALEKFAADIRSFASVSTSFVPAPSDNLLHVLTINDTDFYFSGDGRYDGWGKMTQSDNSTSDA